MDLFSDYDLSCLPSSHGDSQKTTSHRITLETEESQNMTEDADSSRGKSSNKSMPESQEYTSSIDDISRRLQELVESINDKRATDQEVLGSFQNKLVDKVTEMCQQMNVHLYTVYEEKSDELNVKLQEVIQVLGNCTKLNAELVEAREALTSLGV
ncbi:synaptonemal complex central element protein 2 [Lycodopsis pacificus]